MCDMGTYLAFQLDQLELGGKIRKLSANNEALVIWGQLLQGLAVLFLEYST